jgi:uncharacterized protein (DUF2147 family)
MDHLDAAMRIALAFALLLLPVAAHAVAPIDGLWLVQEKDAHIRIELVRGERTGRVVWSRDSLDATGKLRRDTKNPNPALRNHLVRGMVIVSALEPTSPDSTHWKAKVYDPRNGKTYSAKLALQGPDKLDLRGYVGISLLGRTAHWTRVHESAAEDTRPGPAPMLKVK